MNEQNIHSTQKKYPPFSVSMCVYGGDNPEWFDTSLKSVIEQSIQPNEIVVVVDGPIPQTIENILQKYETVCADKIIFKVIRLSHNEGHGKARRTSLANCTNEYVALMDADDISVSNRFERQLECFLEDEELSIVGGNIVEFISDSGETAGKRIVPQTDAEIKEYMKSRCPMNQVTVMFKKQDVEEVGGYMDWYCEEDYYLWLRLALAKKKFANIADILVHVRVGNEMYSRRGGLEYFKSEAKLQKYMLNNHVIRVDNYILNVTKRLIVQVLLPNKVRGWVFRKFAREKE